MLIKGKVMTNKEKYLQFCKNTYVPIYSKSWWMDAVCKPENWDVWVYEKEGEISAAMPYYMELRGDYKYITKAPLTQNNGIIFKNDAKLKPETIAKFQEHVIDAANDFIESLDLDVYEQQYHYSFNNWMPFFWNKYMAITRYTYVIEDTSDIKSIWNGMTSNYRQNIRKGMRSGRICKGDDADEFQCLHKKVFEKQGLTYPFPRELWIRLYDACILNDCAQILYVKDDNEKILSILFLVWDEQAVYHLLGGSVPEYQHLQTYNMLTWEGIKMASRMGLKYDFEGSVIKKISKSMRQFGGKPMPYFRIRKIFNPDILRAEAEQQILSMNNGLKG